MSTNSTTYYLPGPVLRHGPKHRRAGPGALIFVLTAVVGVVIIFSRAPDRFTNPQFWAEDGRFWFQDAYNTGGLSNLLHEHAGYLEVLNRLSAIVAVHSPVAWAPGIFNLSALVCQLIPPLILVSDRFSNVIASRPLRILAAAVYFCLPNSFEVDMNLTNAQWHLALAGVLLLVSLPPGKRRLLWLSDVAIVGLSALTGPFAIVLTPVAAVILYLRRSRHSAVMLGICFLGAVAQAITLINVPRSGPQDLGTLGSLVRILGGQVVIGTIAGQSGYAAVLKDTSSVAPEAVACVLAALLCVVLVVKCGAEHRLLLGFALVVLVASLAHPAPGPTGSLWALLASPGNGARYYFLPMAIGVLVAIALAERVKRPVRSMLGVCLVAMCLLGVRGDWHYPVYDNFHFGRYVAELMKLHKGQTLTIPENPPSWVVILTKR